MSFIDETSQLLGIDQKITQSTFCYACPHKGIVVEGYKKIYELSQTKITLLCQKGEKVEITGENLKISEISHQEISIHGNVLSINFA